MGSIGNRRSELSDPIRPHYGHENRSEPASTARQTVEKTKGRELAQPNLLSGGWSERAIGGLPQGSALAATGQDRLGKGFRLIDLIEHDVQEPEHVGCILSIRLVPDVSMRHIVPEVAYRVRRRSD